ncbi:MAG: aryl-sulfate sulfotransferase, partial [Myxococcota bacterium]
PPETGHTGTPTDPIDTDPTHTAASECALSATNSLRVQCTLSWAEPGGARIEFVGNPSDPVRVFELADAATTHELVAWGLAPATRYTWVATNPQTGESAAGSVWTGGVPPELLANQFVATAPDPDLVDVDAVMFTVGSCTPGWALMVDRFGRVVWYEDVVSLVGVEAPLNALAFIDEHTVLAELGKSTLAEFDLVGNVRMTSEIGVGFEPLLHHDLFEKDGVIWVLGARLVDKLGQPTIVDDVLALDASGVTLDTWTTEDLWPYGFSPWMAETYWGNWFPDAVDFSHANSVWVDDAGDVWASLRHLHAVVKISGGPGTAGFGELLWTAVGSDTSVIWPYSDFTLVGDDPEFSGQHDVHLDPEGRMLLLDNGLGEAGTTRAARFVVDEAAHTLTLDHAIDLGTNCPTQGAVRELPNGDWVVTCAGAGVVGEFAADGAQTPEWTLSARCQNVFPTSIVRGYPIDL